MQLQIMSDLHLEFYGERALDKIDSLEVAADTLVLAGDILNLSTHQRPTPFSVFEQFIQKWKRIVYVPGNHEYYHLSVAEGERMLTQLSDQFSNLFILRGDAYQIDGIQFVGGTMWFPPNKSARKYQSHMTDFAIIQDLVPWVYDQHEDHIEKIRRHGRGSIVVTHHLPHPKSVHAAYEGSPLNPFFMSPEAVPLAEGLGIKLWIHGHTHTRGDYTLPGGTRVVFNPLGYPNEDTPGPNFNPACVVEV